DLKLPADPSLGMDLLGFLVASRDAEAYRGLAAALAEGSVGLRYHVLSSFLSSDKDAKPLGKDAAAALEELLAAGLDDKDEVENTSMSIGGVSVDARIGLVAVWALASQFPDRYRFDPKAPPKDKEVQRRTALDVWRQKQGLPALPPPVERPRPAVLTAAQAA